jgi:hypothetical protein
MVTTTTPTVADTRQHVQLLTQPDFGFDSKGPYYSLQDTNKLVYARNEYVDPAPGYAHDRVLVEAEFEKCRRLAPLPHPLDLILISHEFEGRTNGWYTENLHYLTDDKGEYLKLPNGNLDTMPVGIICLCAKRIPIHPAMTRYLVPHEYGHAIENRLAKIRGMKDHELLEHYQTKVRPTAQRGYGPGKWHNAIGELFANDFRILVMRSEPEFWPHPGHSHPFVTDGVHAWWEEAMKDIREIRGE